MSLGPETIAKLDEVVRREFAVGDRNVGNAIRELLTFHRTSTADNPVLDERRVMAAAAAIANARGARRGAPPISNILDILESISGGKLYDEVIGDARAALKAARAVE